MKLKIRMYNDEYSYEYTVPLVYYKGLYTFSIKDINSNISLYEENGVTILKRSGDLNQVIYFNLNKITTSTITDKDNLCIDVNIETKKVLFNENGFFIDYNILNDLDFVSNHKIYAKILK